ncbi:MAG: response regulator transcription factor [Nostocaceae cyanobacterium]|nr:response regulator transcription factor [Nostocaceae cyanobacterium]
MSSVCIEIVEGNPHLRSLLGWHLQQLDFRIYQAASIYQARDVFLNHQPSLVILDADFPDGDGIEFCRWLQLQQEPLILMLSARNNEADIVAGLKAGADDYLSKPFGMQEFLARVEALIRRKRTPVAPASLDYGVLQIDLVQRRVRFQGEFIDLTPQEFSLLYVLAQAGGMPLSRSELLRRAWPDAIDNPRTIDTHVLSLRKKVELEPRQPSLIQTIRNVGYRLNMEVLKPTISQSQTRLTPERMNNHRSPLSSPR